jgi:hypothetical protein
MNNSTLKLHSINIAPDGTVRFIYDESLKRVIEAGVSTIQRASFLTQQTDGQWLANLEPVKGPILGPFATRDLAIEAERDWINHHWLPAPYPLLPCPL